jgi:UDP-N-acetylmuramoyl-L-alanyl-D-glutamate--2,6-diaminopimelate ligase
VVESGAVKLEELFKDIVGARLLGGPDVMVTSLSYRSAQAAPGHLFFCVPGQVHDGHDYAAQAVEQGAVALCVERALPLPVPQMLVPAVRNAMGPVAAALYEHPSARMATVGITGTNGKTTTAFLTAYLLDQAGRRAGLLGTVERRIGGVVFPAERTTPEAIDVQQDLAMMVDAGDQAAVMEVSSHGLSLGRADGTTFTAVAFTNLTQDHLDYHGTLDAYFAAKSRLFLESAFARNRPVAVINIDDAFGRILAERLPSDRLLTFSTEAGGRADLEARSIELSAAGTTLDVVVRGRAAAAVERGAGRPVVRGGEIVRSVRTGLLGRFNVENTLTALGIGVGIGLDFDHMADAVAHFPGVPGRMERVSGDRPFAVLVDYAHTPDSIENVLRTARAVSVGRLIALLGCGGNRDRGKRPKMGRAGEQGADVLIITSDNPRDEEPDAIIADVVAGLDAPERAVIEPDRRVAIERALREARPGDIVLLLGKGHESGQEFAAKRTVPFDDRVVARDALAALDAGRT